MIRHIKKDHIHTVSVYAFAILFAIGLSFFTKDPRQLQQDYGLTGDVQQEAPKQKDEALVLYKKEPFDKVVVKAKAYVVYDIVNKRVISGKDENTVLPLASISKIMMAITALSMYDKNTAITINKKDSYSGAYDLGLRKNQSWRLDELLKYTLVFSSNDGAYIIANQLAGKDTFVDKMNTVAKSLALNMAFTDPAGLDLNGKIGGEGSALDVARMMVYAQKYIPSILDSTTKKRVSVVSSTGILTGVPNTNQDVNNFIGIEASKTGFTDVAGGNLAIIVDITVGHPVVIVVLGSTKNDRFTDVYRLYTALKESVIN